MGALDACGVLHGDLVGHGGELTPRRSSSGTRPFRCAASQRSAWCCSIHGSRPLSILVLRAVCLKPAVAWRGPRPSRGRLRRWSCPGPSFDAGARHHFLLLVPKPRRSRSLSRRAACSRCSRLRHYAAVGALVALIVSKRLLRCAFDASAWSSRRSLILAMLRGAAGEVAKSLDVGHAREGLQLQQPAIAASAASCAICTYARQAPVQLQRPHKVARVLQLQVGPAVAHGIQHRLMAVLHRHRFHH